MDNPVDKEFIDGYNTALDDASEWFTVYLDAGGTFDDWVDSGKKKFLEEMLEEEMEE